MKKLDESKIENLMNKLEITREEAIKVIEYDEKVNKAKEKDTLEYDLTEEQKKNAKENTITSRGANGKQTNRKKDQIKAEITNHLAQILIDTYAVVIDMVNPERQFSFMLNGDKYEVTLIKKKK